MRSEWILYPMHYNKAESITIHDDLVIQTVYLVTGSYCGWTTSEVSVQKPHRLVNHLINDSSGSVMTFANSLSRSIHF